MAEVEGGLEGGKRDGRRGNDDPATAEGGEMPDGLGHVGRLPLKPCHAHVVLGHAGFAQQEADPLVEVVLRVLGSGVPSLPDGREPGVHEHDAKVRQIDAVGRGQDPLGETGRKQSVVPDRCAGNDG